MMDLLELLAEPLRLPDMDNAEADGLRNTLRGFLLSPEWTWMKRQIESDIRSAFGNLKTCKNVGEGAVEVTRAQGAMIALERILKLPAETLRMLDERAKIPEETS